MTRSGSAYELPTWEHLTRGSASSSSPGLLPTPTASDRFGPGTHGEGGQDLRTTIALLMTDRLLPTPTTEPDTGNGHARNLGTEAKLLPTPTGTNQRGNRTNGRGEQLLPGVALALGAITGPRSNDGN